MTLIDVAYPDDFSDNHRLFDMINHLGFLSDWFSLYTPKFLMGYMLVGAYGDSDLITLDIIVTY